MNITTTPLAVAIWTDPDARAEDKEQTAIAVRMSIAERVTAARRQKEKYATALEYLADIPLPNECRMPTLPDECLEIERYAWRTFIDDLHLRVILSIGARNKLDNQLYEHRRGYGNETPLPPFTEANVFSFFEQTCANIPNLITDALVEVFHWLTPSPKWTGCKTSDAFKIGRKVVLCNVARPRYSQGLDVNYNRRSEVDALGNTLSMLDGKGARKSRADKEEDRKLIGSYADAWAFDWREDRVYEDAYLTAKAFGNGNVHITFKRMDLIAKINQAGADMVLQQADREATRGFSH